MKTVILIDGNLFAWRAFATRKLSTSKGVPTSVISGMLQMIKKLHERFEYDCVIICWDGKGGSKLRKDLFPEYKANRKEKKKELQSLFDQMIMARGFFEALNVRQAIVDAVEGDDIMGILSKHYAKKYNVIIASDDKDLLQLIRKRVKVFRSRTDQLVDIKIFRKMYDGLDPAELIKVKSLMGDNGDNVPGVMGIGEKGAIAIVKKFDSLKDILGADAPDRKEKLVRDNIKTVNLAFKLVKICRMPMELGPKAGKQCKKVMKALKGKRSVDPDIIELWIRRFEMKHRNLSALAQILSLQLINSWKD